MARYTAIQESGDEFEDSPSEGRRYCELLEEVDAEGNVIGYEYGPEGKYKLPEEGR